MLDPGNARAARVCTRRSRCARELFGIRRGVVDSLFLIDSALRHCLAHCPHDRSHMHTCLHTWHSTSVARSVAATCPRVQRAHLRNASLHTLARSPVSMCTTAAHAAPFARGCISLHTAPARDTASGTSMQFLAVPVPTLPTSRATRHCSTPSPRKLHWSCPGPSWHKVFLIHTCVHVHSHAGISRKGKVQGSSPSSIPDLLLPARPALDLAPADCFTDVCFASRWCCGSRRRRTRAGLVRRYRLLLPHGPSSSPARTHARPHGRSPVRRPSGSR